MNSTPLIAFDQHAATTVAAVLLPGQQTPALHALTSETATIHAYSKPKANVIVSRSPPLVIGNRIFAFTSRFVPALYLKPAEPSTRLRSPSRNPSCSYGWLVTGLTDSSVEAPLLASIRYRRGRETFSSRGHFSRAEERAAEDVCQDGQLRVATYSTPPA